MEYVKPGETGVDVSRLVLKGLARRDEVVIATKVHGMTRAGAIAR